MSRGSRSAITDEVVKKLTQNFAPELSLKSFFAHTVATFPILRRQGITPAWFWSAAPCGLEMESGTVVRLGNACLGLGGGRRGVFEGGKRAVEEKGAHFSNLNGHSSDSCIKNTDSIACDHPWMHR